MNCKKCGAEIPAENINLDRAIAKCSECNAVFGFANEIEGADNPQKKERVEVPLPEKISVTKNDYELIIAIKWFSKVFKFFAIFSFCWDAFLILWLGIILSTDNWDIALFASLHAITGIGITYYTIAIYLNKTFIGIDKRDILIRHKPLWWFGNKNIATSDVKQLYCKEKIGYTVNNSPIMTYSLLMITQDNKQIKLVTGLEEVEQVLYVEQEIERFLEIEDQQVSGEIK